MTQETEREKLIKSLRIKADMILMGERIGWGSETELMYQAADAVELMYQAADALEALQGQARASLGKGEAKPVEVGEVVAISGELADAITDMYKSLRALRLELPESIVDDVSLKFRRVEKAALQVKKKAIALAKPLLEKKEEV